MKIDMKTDMKTDTKIDMRIDMKISRNLAIKIERFHIVLVLIPFFSKLHIKVVEET